MGCPTGYKEVPGRPDLCSLRDGGQSADQLIASTLRDNPNATWDQLKDIRLTGQGKRYDNLFVQNTTPPGSDPISQILEGSFLGGKFTDEELFGSVPEGVPFEEVDVNRTILESILGTTENLPQIEEVVAGLNAITTAQDLERVRELVPQYDALTAQASDATSSLLRGELPFEDALRVVADRSEMANALGLQGASTNATLRDLGLNRLDAISQGQSFFNDIIQRQETVSSSNKQINPGAFLLTPAQAVEAQFRNNENVQAANQSAEFLASRPLPGASAILETMLARYETGNDPLPGSDANTTGE